MIIEKAHTTMILSILYQEKAFKSGIIDLTNLKKLLKRESSQIQNRLSDMENAGLIKTESINGFPSHLYIWLTEDGKNIAPYAEEYLNIYRKVAKY